MGAKFGSGLLKMRVRNEYINSAGIWSQRGAKKRGSGWRGSGDKRGF